MEEGNLAYLGGVYPGGEGLDFLNSLNPELQFGDYASFMKAMSANTGTAAGGPDISQLTGGAALRFQSMEKTLKASIQTDRHFLFYNSLVTGKAGATIHEWTTKDYIGGYPGSAFNSELGDIPETQGRYQRKYGEVKFLMTMRDVSYVQTRQNTIQDTIALEKIDAIREIKTSVEWALFWGDSAVQPIEFDGIIKQILAVNNPDLVKDARGKGLSFGANEILDIARAVGDFENFGLATHAYMSRQVAVAELNQKLTPALRAGVGGSTRNRDVEMGTVVTGIRSGDDETIKVRPDVFLREGDMPFEARPGKYPDLVTAAGLTVAGGLAVAAAASATSQFGAEHAGLYYWGVESIGQEGRSLLVKSAQQLVAAGEKATLTITNPNDAKVTGFMLHRSRKNGTNLTNDFREMIRIPRQAGATTVYVDDNQRIPGTSPVIITNQDPGQDAIKYVRLFPMVLFPLYPTRKATRPWAQLDSGLLILFKPRQHGLILNVLPESATWKPFN